MATRLPPDVDAFRRRLLQSCFGRKRGVDAQVDGLRRCVATLERELSEIMGSVAARATLRRAMTVAARRYPQLALLLVTDPPDFDRLRQELSGGTPEAAREAVLALLDEWLAVLVWLLDDALLPLLRGAEVDLAAGEPSPHQDEEGR